MPTILLTGGTGYIASHTAVALINAGYTVVLLDNLSNSTADVADKIHAITGTKPVFYQGDITCADSLTPAFANHDISAVMHFAGLKSVGESVQNPTHYHTINVGGTETLLSVMDKFGVGDIVFSSSATVYGVPQYLPLDENHPIAPINPYGQNKADIEVLLQNWATPQTNKRTALLRYFNPVGADPSGLIGESNRNTPNNLAPYVCKVITGDLPHVNILGTDWDTPDGTGVRDYIHVCDLADGHVRALQGLDSINNQPINLGTGYGTSVLELISAFESAWGQPIPTQNAPRRDGDVATCYASPTLAQKHLNWTAQKTITQMATDHYNFAINQAE